MGLLRTLLHKLRMWVLKLLGADHMKLDEWLDDPGNRQIMSICAKNFDKMPTEADERRALEKSYEEGQKACPHLSGYRLRFILYWYLGKRRGEWD